MPETSRARSNVWPRKLLQNGGKKSRKKKSVKKIAQKICLGLTDYKAVIPNVL